MILNWVLAAVAAAGGISADAARDEIATKFRPGVVLDLSGLHLDPSDPAEVCGHVEVDRHFGGIKFIADTSRHIVWLEKAPPNEGANSPLPPKVAGLIIGGIGELEDAWRRCNSKGAALPTG